MPDSFTERTIYTHQSKAMNRFLRILFPVLLIAFEAAPQPSAEKMIAGISYYTDGKAMADPYVRERCVMDFSYPTDRQGFATIIWFHGGGLTGGEKFLPEELRGRGVAVIAPNYRLYPKVKAPEYLRDAAAAIAWVFNHISEYGGDPSLIFVSGHSAGGYLATMTALDKIWLAPHGIDADQIAGVIPFSGHTITHMTVREERGIPSTRPVIDSLAPLYHVRSDAPPLLLITGDRELEMLGRYEENAYLMRMMKVAGHKETHLLELDGYDHGMAQPAFPLLLKEVRRITDLKKQTLPGT